LNETEKRQKRTRLEKNKLEKNRLQSACHWADRKVEAFSSRAKCWTDLI